MNKKVDDALVDAVMRRLESGELNAATASVLLGVSERQVYKIKRARANPSEKKERKPRKSPPNKTEATLEARIVGLYSTEYRGFSYVHFHEKLSSDEEIEVNLKTLERLLKRAGLISPFATKKTKREAKRALQAVNQAAKQDNEQSPRLDDSIIVEPSNIHNRHRHVSDFGALLQLDARKDFYVPAEKWTLHLAIDVAAGIFVGAWFDREETLLGYQHVLHQIVEGYGIPKCILSDNRTVFEYVGKGSGQESKNTFIQFKFSCIQLGIRLNTTSVATYKSVIERANGTFGRRLPQELRHAGITDMDAANDYLVNFFMAEMNQRFARSYPGRNVFQKGPDEETLNNIIGNVTRRIFDKASCIKYFNEFYYATAYGKIVAFTKGTKALVIRTFDKRLIISVDSVAYKAVRIDEYEHSDEKECNPDSEAFIASHRISPSEFVNYKKSHLSPWNYYSFEKYVSDEMEQIRGRH